MVYIPNLTQALTNGAQYAVTWEQLTQEITIECRPIGELVVPSGWIIACEPFMFDYRYQKPFTKQTPAGRYPVVLSIAHTTAPWTSDEIVCATLRITPQVPQRWELAVLPGQDVRTLKEHERFGYPVDGGTGGFLDAAIAEIWQTQACDPDLLAAVAAQRGPVWWSDILVDPATGANVLAFPSGAGDGVYASYWGLDQQGELACLVTDFGIDSGEVLARK